MMNVTVMAVMPVMMFVVRMPGLRKSAAECANRNHDY
jgi:hypothetical protein